MSPRARRYWTTLPDRRTASYRTKQAITHLAAVDTSRGWAPYRWATSATAAQHALDRLGLDGKVLPATTTEPRP